MVGLTDLEGKIAELEALSQEMEAKGRLKTRFVEINHQLSEALPILEGERERLRSMID